NHKKLQNLTAETQGARSSTEGWIYKNKKDLRAPSASAVRFQILPAANASASSRCAGSPLPWAKSGLPPPLPPSTASDSLISAPIAGPSPLGRAKPMLAPPASIKATHAARPASD